MSEQDDPQASFETWELEENWTDSEESKTEKNRNVKKREPSFEEAMSELKTISEKIASREISLEDSVRYYERGLKLIHFCQQKLDRVNQRIQILDKQNDSAGLSPYSMDDYESEQDV